MSRPSLPGYALGSLAVLLVLVLGAPRPATAGEGPDAVALKRLVHQDCGSCHGLTLKGGLGPDLRPQTLQHYQPDILASVILDGIPGTAMPSWRPLMTEADAVWIAQYLLQSEPQ